VNPERNTASRVYRHRVDALLKQLDAIRQRQNLLQTAGVRGRALASLEQKAEHLGRELATTIATRADSTEAAVRAT
jgi:hypothetical protein